MILNSIHTLMRSARLFIFSCFSILILLFSVSCTSRESHKKNVPVLNRQVARVSRRIKPQYKPAFTEFKRADSLMNEYQFKAALEECNRVVATFPMKKDSEKKVYYLLIVGKCHYRLNQFEEAKHQLEKAWMTIKNNPLQYEVFVAKVLNLYSKTCSNLQQIDTALFYLNKALEHELSYVNQDHYQIADLYYSLGRLYRFELLNYKKAEVYYLKSKDIYENSKQTIPEDLVALYYGLSGTYKLKKDYEKALIYAFKALDLTIANPPLQEGYLSNTYSLIGNIYIRQEKYPLAIKYLQKGIDINEKFHKEGIQWELNNIGGVYFRLHDFKKAEYYYRKALKRGFKLNNLFIVAESYYDLGEVFQVYGKMDSAALYFKKMMALKMKLYKSHHPEISLSYLTYGNFYKDLKAYDSALIYYQKVFIETIKDFHETNVYVNPTPLQILEDYLHFTSLSKKALVFKDLFAKTKDLNYLSHSLNCYLLLDKVLEIQKQSHDDEYSEMTLSVANKEIYNDGIKVSYELFKATGNKEYVEHALIFMERSKANVLLENLKGIEASSKVGVPDSVIEEEGQLKSHLARYKNQLYMEKGILKPKEISVINNQIFIISQKLDRLKKALAYNNPSYYQTKYGHSGLSIKKIQGYAADNNSVFAEYFIGRDNVYAIAVKSNSVNFIEIPNAAELNRKIFEFQKLIKQEGSGSMAENFYKLKKQGYSLYNSLLKPLLQDFHLQENKRNQLIIVPDENLSYMPFEAFVTYPVKTKRVDFKSLPYLIKKFNVQYSHSIQLFFQKISHKKHSLSLVAFDYYQMQGTKNKIPSAQMLGSAKEIKLIHTIMGGGKYFSGKESSEENFKKYASFANIIHLAVHGAADTLNPFNSNLVFCKQPKSPEDGVLYVHELYNVKINAELVVLGACQTGVGINQKGEGVMSLGRAFKYSGASSLIMSLWKINDRTSSHIIGDFYKNLSENKNISEALTHAKLEYLDNADEVSAHPKNWSGLVNYGNCNDRIPMPHHQTLYWAVGVLIIVLLMLLAWALYKKRQVSLSSNTIF